LRRIGGNVAVIADRFWFWIIKSSPAYTGSKITYHSFCSIKKIRIFLRLRIPRQLVPQSEKLAISDHYCKSIAFNCNAEESLHQYGKRRFSIPKRYQKYRVRLG